MVLLGIQAGSREVNVRVDDLDAKQRAEVRKSMDLIDDIWCRYGTAPVKGIIGGLIGALVVLIGLMIAGLPDSHIMTALGVTLCTSTAAGLITWLVARSLVRRRQARDIAGLAQLLVSSDRCRELMDAYREANPWFRKVEGSLQPVLGRA